MGGGKSTRFAIASWWLVLLCVGILAPAAGMAANTEWEQFLRRHTRPDGRVVDGAGCHSEGQGVGMLLAVHFRDRKAFERFWDWTRRNLMVREDGLLAWRWTPEAGVTDRNNASDGDILVAWALIRGAAQWGSEAYLAAGLSLARSVRENLVRRTPRGLALLPGAAGFEQDGSLTLNLSYWVFPAFEELSRVDRTPVWSELVRSGHRLLAEAKFGRWALPPDWLQEAEKLTLPEGRQARFGYDAIRIPLYLMWSGAGEDAVKPFRSFWGHFRGASFLPAWTNLKDDSVDSHDAFKGVKAIAAAVEAYPALKQARLPEGDDSQSYYSDALLILTRMMLWERAGR